MKKLQYLMIILAVTGSMYTISAQRVVTVYPRHGTVVRTVYKPIVVVHKGATFHFSDGVWYNPRHGSYVVCAAPVGVVVKRLPRGREIVRINRRKLYRYRGVVYQKVKRGFVVVQV